MQTENADRHGVGVDCLDTPAKSSCFLEVISDQMWLRSAPCVHRGAQSSIKSCFFFLGSFFKRYLSDKPECTGCENAAWSVITSRRKRLQEYPECGAHWPCTTVDARGIATPNHGTRTHLWLEVYYKIPPSAAVPMRTEQKFQGKEWRWHIIQGFHPSDAVWRCFILIIFCW